MALANAMAKLASAAKNVCHGLNQQVRTVYVEVKGGNFEQAMGRYGRKMRQDKTLQELADRKFYIKPSERRVIAKKERAKKMAKRDFRNKIKWFLSQAD